MLLLAIVLCNDPMIRSQGSGGQFHHSHLSYPPCAAQVIITTLFRRRKRIGGNFQNLQTYLRVNEQYGNLSRRAGSIFLADKDSGKRAGVRSFRMGSSAGAFYYRDTYLIASTLPWPASAAADIQFPELRRGERTGIPGDSPLRLRRRPASAPSSQFPPL